MLSDGGRGYGLYPGIDWLPGCVSVWRDRDWGSVEDYVAEEFRAVKIGLFRFDGCPTEIVGL